MVKTKCSQCQNSGSVFVYSMDTKHELIWIQIFIHKIKIHCIVVDYIFFSVSFSLLFNLLTRTCHSLHNHD